MRFPRKHELLKVVSLNAAQVLVNFLLGFLSVKITSTCLGAKGMALTGSLRNFVAMVKSLGTLGISNSATKLVAKNRHDLEELSAIYATFFWFSLLMSAVLSVITFAAAPFLSEALFFDPSYIWPLRLLASVLPLVVLNVFWLAVYNGFEAFRKIIFIQIISNAAVFAATVYFILTFGMEGGLYAIAVGEALMALVTWLFFRRDRTLFRTHLPRVLHMRFVRQIGKFMLMGLVTSILAPVAQLLIRTCIVDHSSVIEAGLWDAVNRISGFYMLAVGSGLSLYYMPRLASLTSERAFGKEVRYYYRYFVPLFTGALVLLYLLRHVVVPIALSDEFQPVADLLTWQLAGDLFRVLALAFGMRVLVEAQVTRYLIAEILFNGLYLAGAFWLVPHEGGNGALKAYAIAHFLNLILMLYWFRSVWWRQETTA